MNIFTPNFLDVLQNFDTLDKISFKNDLISVEHSD